MLHLHYRAYSEVGLVRSSNQDSGYASPRMLMVADGMGGAAAGDLASAIAITFMRDADQGEHQGNAMFNLLDQTIEGANTAIADMVETDPSLDGMGTTICGAMFDGSQLAIAHLGDSRGYLVRDGELKRLTHDHSWVQSLIDEGRITEEQAATHPHRSLVLKVINGTKIANPDHSLLDVQVGDRVMFCSDGLNGMTDDATIHKALAIADPEACIKSLVAAAHAGGGYDNITIVLADVADKAPTNVAPVTVGSVNDVNFEVDVDMTRPMPVKLEKPEHVPEPAPEVERYQPIRRGRRAMMAALISVIGVGIVLGAIVLITQMTVAGRYYVGVSGDKVAIYNGIPDAFGPLKFSKLERETPTLVANLPELNQEEVRRNSYHQEDLAAIEKTVSELSVRAEKCVSVRRERARATITPGSASASPTPAPRADEC